MGCRRRLRDEAGFTILESTIALSLVFVVLVALLGALTTGARGLITGRQRSAALALANEVIEDARGRAYGDVGHDLDSDPTLATDVENIEGVAPNLVYKETNEPLAASAVDAGNDGGTVNNPLYPFSPHTFTTQREATVFTTSVYVTTVTPPAGDGDPYKRITAKVKWSPSQYATAARSVVISSFLYNAGSPPDPKLVGSGEADGGAFTVTGTMAGISLADASITFSYVNGAIDSIFVKSAKGLARSATSEVNLLSGSLSGCSPLGPHGATCDPAKAEADADNDSGTAPADTDQEGPNNAALATITAGPALSVGLGSGTAQAQASARSCWTCQPGGSFPVGDDDRLPYFKGTATGPASTSVDFHTEDVDGSLLSIGTGCSLNCATVTVDRNDSGSNQRLDSTASLSFPSLSLMNFAAGAPGGYSGMVKIGAVSATATAASGPGAGAPTVTGTPVTVQMWDDASGGYKTATVTPGDAPPATDPTAHASFSVGQTSVVMDATLHWNRAVTSQTSSGGAVTDASASLTNWLFVDLHVVMTSADGTVTDLNLHLDYGRIAAAAAYEAVA